MRIKTTPSDTNAPANSTNLLSWPLIVGSLVYLALLANGETLLGDGDTYWHIATGRWIIEHLAVPAQDPFSHTMHGAPWTAHEWLSEVILAAAHDAGGWTLVIGLAALAFSGAVALLTRFLLKELEPAHALMFAALSVAMAAPHLHARPHLLAMPLLMIWAAGLARAGDSNRAPSLWLLPVMTLWANLHGGFTLGLAFAFAFALEAVFAARRNGRAAQAAKSWGIFLGLASVSALLTPHGLHGLLFTWKIFGGTYALQHIAEWQSPNFHYFQPLEVWLLAGLAMALHLGIRLPAVRLALLLGLLHLALTHARNIELIGLLAPLFLARPLAAQWRQTESSKRHLESADRAFRKLAQPARWSGVVLTAGILASLTFLVAWTMPPQPKESVIPAAAVQAARQAGIHGAVLNDYGFGGYLIYAGTPPFIDGRADMYGDDFFREYVEALSLKTSDGLEKLLQKYKIEWTLLPPGNAAVALLDHLPEWRRLHGDKVAVVHVRKPPATNEPGP